MAKRRNQRQRRKGTSRPVPATSKASKASGCGVKKAGEIEFVVTSEPPPNPAVDQLPPGVWQRAQYLYEELNESNAARIAPRLRELHLLYPEVPTFGNWRALCLRLLGREAEAFAILRQVHARHPDHLFTRTDLAREAIHRGDFNTARNLIGPSLCLPAEFLGRKVFHITEYLAFYFTVGEFFAYQGAFAEAEEELKWLQRLASKHEATQRLESLLTQKSRETILKLIQERKDPHSVNGASPAAPNPEPRQNGGQLELALDLSFDLAKVA